MGLRMHTLPTDTGDGLDVQVRFFGGAGVNFFGSQGIITGAVRDGDLREVPSA